MKALLLSNSTNHGQKFLEHAMPWIKENFAGVKKVLFVPYALQDHDGYAAKAQLALQELGIEVISAHTSENPVELLDKVDAVYIGGGNTFRLLNMLYKTGLINAIPEFIKSGKPYLGASAGTNVATLSIKTTNDMPIVYPPSFDALQLVRFQINPHYVDANMTPTHMGETREKRIEEFHEANNTPVLGLREGSALKIEDGKALLLGPHSARVFLQGQTPYEVEPGSVLGFNLKVIPVPKSISHGPDSPRFMAKPRAAEDERVKDEQINMRSSTHGCLM